MLAAGMPAEAIVAAVEEMEAATTPERSARQERNARYYAARKERLKASEKRLKTSEPEASEKRLKTSESVLNSDALAHVRDITTNSEIYPRVGVVVEREGDDWPDGDANHHAKLILTEVASPWLDPNKSLALNTTIGRLAAWRKAGASWRFDVLPTVRAAVARRRDPVRSWKFFEEAVLRSAAENRAALTIPEAGTIIPFRPTAPPVSRDEKISAAWDYAMEKIARDEQS